MVISGAYASAVCRWRFPCRPLLARPRVGPGTRSRLPNCDDAQARDFILLELEGGEGTLEVRGGGKEKGQGW